MKNTIVNLLGADHPWVGSIHYYDIIGSTNDEAKRLAEQGAPHGTVLIAVLGNVKIIIHIVKF